MALAAAQVGHAVAEAADSEPAEAPPLEDISPPWEDTSDLAVPPQAVPS